MGGTNETQMSGLRLHVSANEVHVHDDNNKLKFELNSQDFKHAIEDAFTTFKKQDGIIKIDGETEVSLYLFKENKSTGMFLNSSKNKLKELDDFIKGL